MATNKINGKSYIGQTIRSLEKRKREHITDALNDNKNSMYFHKAIRKYGQDNFDWEILYECGNMEDLNKLEIYYIKLYNTYNNGYNLNAGGNNAIPSEETRRKISESTKGKNHSNYGKHHLKETRKKISEAHKGKHLSEETRKKISETLMGRFVGKDNPTARVVIINGKYFATRKNAAKYLEVDPTTIRNRILHKIKWSGYKYA